MYLKTFSSISLVAALTLAVFNAGCGGGGGSSSTTPTTTTTTSSSISGTVAVASSSAQVSSSAVTESSVNSVINNATITLSSYDKSDKELGKTVVSSTETGGFSASLPLSTSGGYVIITTHKDGYIDFSRRIDYDTPADLNILAEMDVANVAVAPVDHNGTTSIGSASIVKNSVTGKDYVMFALFKDSTGVSKMMVGKSALRKMQLGDKPESIVEFPVKSIPDDVSSLVGSINSYDPTKPEDAKKFPGSYADSKGNKLVSAGFDFIDIRTDSGQTIGAAIKKAVAKGTLKKADADASYYVTRVMTGSNCDNLKIGDADKNASNGYNIPIFTYSYNSGLWVQLGQGTIVKSSTSAVSDFKAYATSQEAVDGCKAGNGEYVKIEVTNKDYLSSPWNLDHILTTEPKQLCVQGKVVDQNGTTITTPLSLSFYDDDYNPTSFNSGYTNSKNDGTYKLTTVLTDNTDTDRQGTLSYYNPYTYNYETKTVSLGDIGSCTTANIAITRPQMCTVTGQIKDDTGAVKANESFYFYSNYPYMSRYGMTGSDGKFSMETLCSRDQMVYARNQNLASFNPNGTKGSDEVSDDGQTVDLGVLTIANQAPYAYGWVSSNSVKVNTSMDISVYGYDYDNDVPLTWALKDNGTAIDNNTTTGNYLSKTITHSFTSEGDHVLTLEVSDSKGKKTTVDVATVNVVNGNRAPSISSYYAANNVMGPNKSNTVFFQGYDRDGDTLTWNVKRGTETLCQSTTSSAGSVNDSCKYTTGSTDNNETLTLTISDGSKTAQKQLTVKVENTAPIIDQATASKYRTEVGEQITLTAVMYDIDGDAITPTLYANDVKVTTCTATGTGTQADPMKGSCTYTMPTTPGTVTFRLDVSDGSKTRSASFTVTAGNVADLGITIK